MGQAKKVLLGLVMISTKSEVFMRGHEIFSVPRPRFSLAAAGNVGRRKSHEGPE